MFPKWTPVEHLWLNSGRSAKPLIRRGSYAWWSMPVILGRVNLEDLEFKVNLSYKETVSK